MLSHTCLACLAPDRTAHGVATGLMILCNRACDENAIAFQLMMMYVHADWFVVAIITLLETKHI